MKDFSFLYGPIRTWAAVAATIALAAVVGYRATDSGPFAPQDQDPCPSVQAVATGSYAAGPTSEGGVDGDECRDRSASCDEPDLASCNRNDGVTIDRSSSVDTGPVPIDDAAGSGEEAENRAEGEGEDGTLDRADGDESPWDRVGESGGRVPFVSLKPSEEGLTEAGQNLVPSTTRTEPSASATG